MNEIDQNTHNISIIFKAKKNGRDIDIIQGEPFTWGVLIKNIDTKPSPEATIRNFGIQNLDNNYFLEDTLNSKHLRSLNPDEEIYMELDSVTSFLDGSMWAYLSITANDDEKKIKCHQVGHHHKNITPCVNMDDGITWIDSIYIHKKMEVLQAKTNKHILLLTILTTWEAIFGIKKTLENIILLIGFFLQKSLDGINYILQLMH